MLTSSIYPRAATLNVDPAMNTDILSSDIPIISDLVKPGGGGILRLYFAFTFGASPAIVTIFNNGTAKGTLNADNANSIITDGYYRFDIDIETGDNINLRANQSITTATSFFRAHLVQFGA